MTVLYEMSSLIFITILHDISFVNEPKADAIPQILQ